MSVIDKAVYEKVIAKIDIDELAKDLTPVIKREIKEGVSEYIRNMDWFEIFDSGKLEKLLGEVAIKAIEKGINGEKVRKHTKK